MCVTIFAGLSNGLNLICQFTAANLFTLIICLVRETFSAARKVNSSSSNSPCGYKLLNLVSFSPAQRKRSEWSRVQTEKEPATPSRTARPAWAAWREEVSHVTHHHVFLSLSHTLSRPLSVTVIVASGERKSIQPLVKGWLLLRPQVSWQQSALFFLTIASLQWSANDIFRWLCMMIMAMMMVTLIWKC